jgi:hypothetical protein
MSCALTQLAADIREALKTQAVERQRRSSASTYQKRLLTSPSSPHTCKTARRAPIHAKFSMRIRAWLLHLRPRHSGPATALRTTTARAGLFTVKDRQTTEMTDWKTCGKERGSAYPG